MYRENDFQSNIKWFIIGIAGLASICQLILLFYEFSFYSGIGMLINGLYHMISVACPGLIVFIFLKNSDNKEIYSDYLLALQSASFFFIDLCLIIKYIMLLKGTKGLSIILILLCAFLLLLETFSAFCFIKYGLDKITCVIPMILSVFVMIFRGCIYSTVDAKLNTFAYKIVDKSIFTIWTFMHLFFLLALVVCIILYIDSSFLRELLDNPKGLFTKNTIFGTYTNLYLTETSKEESQEVVSTTPEMKMNIHTTENNTGMKPIIGSCSNCGNAILFGDKSCSSCGKPIIDSQSNIYTQSNVKLSNNTGANKNNRKATQIPIIIAIIAGLLLVFSAVYAPILIRYKNHIDQNQDIMFAKAVNTGVSAALAEEDIYDEVYKASDYGFGIEFSIDKGDVSSECVKFNKYIEKYLVKQGYSEYKPKYSKGGASSFMFKYIVNQKAEFTAYYASSSGSRLNQFYPQLAYSGTTNSSSGNSSNYTTCKFKNRDGSQTCTNRATHGDLCDYHFNMLNDTYEQLEDDWNNMQE